MPYQSAPTSHNTSPTSSLEPKMGKRKRNANGNAIYDRPSDFNIDHLGKDLGLGPGRRKGTDLEHKKQKQKNADDALALDQMPELGLRKCAQCHATKPLGSFSTPAGTSIKNAVKVCTKCLDKDKPKRVESGGTKYTRERERTRSLDSEWQSVVKATRVGSKGYGEYEEACKAANPEQNYCSSKASPSTGGDGREAFEPWHVCYHFILLVV